MESPDTSRVETLDNLLWALGLAGEDEIAHTNVDDGEGGTRRVSVTGRMLFNRLAEQASKIEKLERAAEHSMTRERRLEAELGMVRDQVTQLRTNMEDE